jgi:hypothetical protein
MVTITDEEFLVIYNALSVANDPFSQDSVEDIIEAEWNAWVVVKDLMTRRIFDPDEKDPETLVSPTLSEN